MGRHGKPNGFEFDVANHHAPLTLENVCRPLNRSESFTVATEPEQQRSTLGGRGMFRGAGHAFSLAVVLPG